MGIRGVEVRRCLPMFFIITLPVLLLLPYYYYEACHSNRSLPSTTAEKGGITNKGQVMIGSHVMHCMATSLQVRSGRPAGGG